jgi:hypothetical protein
MLDKKIIEEGEGNERKLVLTKRWKQSAKDSNTTQGAVTASQSQRDVMLQ